jgi:hypothetical protein
MHSRNSVHFMEGNLLLPCCQKLTTGPCSEPDESNLRVLILRSLLVLTNLRLRLPSHFLLSALPTKTLCPFIFCPTHATCSAHPLLLVCNKYPHSIPHAPIDNAKLRICFGITINMLLFIHVCLICAVLIFCSNESKTL